MTLGAGTRLGPYEIVAASGADGHGRGRYLVMEYLEGETLAPVI